MAETGVIHNNRTVARKSKERWRFGSGSGVVNIVEKRNILNAFVAYIMAANLVQGNLKPTVPKLIDASLGFVIPGEFFEVDSRREVATRSVHARNVHADADSIAANTRKPDLEAAIHYNRRQRETRVRFLLVIRLASGWLPQRMYVVKMVVQV